MKKLFACLITVLVVLQAFFVPVSADGEDQNTVFVQKSLAETTLQEDLLGDPDASDQDVENYVFGRSLHLNLPSQFEIFSAAYESDGYTYSFYLYLKNSDFYDIGTSGSLLWPIKDFRLKLKRPIWSSGHNPFLGPEGNDYFPNSTDFDPTTLYSYEYMSFSANVVDNTRHVAKIRLDLPVTSPYVLHINSNTISIDIDHIWYRFWGCDPVRQDFEGGVYTSSLRIDFSSSPANAPLRSSSSRMLSHLATNYTASEPVLKLDVSMMSERFSSSLSTKWHQLNSAAFLIPNKFVNKYGDYLYVHFQYGVYNDVPMLVGESQSLFDDARTYSDFSPAIVTPNLNTDVFAAPYFYSKISFCPYFIYSVDSISHSSDGGFDVPSSVILASWNSLKSNETDLRSATLCSSYEEFNIWKGPKDSWSTTSLVDAHGWWSWLFAGAFPWETIVDDSIDAPSTVVVDEVSDLTSLSLSSDSQISSSYLVDSSYSGDLRSLATSALSSDSSLAIVRYSMTDYSVREFNSLYFDGDYHFHTIFDNYGYVCENAIISGFQILQIGLSVQPYDTCDIEALLLSGEIHLIDVEMEPQDYAGPAESGDHLKEGIITRFDPSKWLKRLIAILVVFIALVVVYYALKFIGAFRSAFGRRHGDPPPDKKKRRRLFGRRKD